METGEAPNPPFIITYRSAITTHVSHSIPLFCFQVLVAQIGNVLGLKDVDSGIDDFRSTNSLSFDQFRFYLCKEVSTLSALHKRDFFQLFPRFSALKTVSLECGFFCPLPRFLSPIYLAEKMGIGHAISPGKGEGHQIKWKPPFPTRLLPTSPDNWGAPLQAQKRGRG